MSVKGVPKPAEDMFAGNVFKTNGYCYLKIIEYRTAKDVIVSFVDTGYTLSTQAKSIRGWSVKDRIMPNVYGVGYIGDGPYKSSVKGTDTSEYKCWSHMMERCYSKRFQKNNPTYIGCTVCEEWHNFQNFAEWYFENHPLNDVEYQLDKDIKTGHCKVYSPETCIFATPRDNTLEMNKRVQQKESVLISPDGELYNVLNVSSFCRKHNLSNGNISSVIRGTRNHHKGWRLFKGFDNE